MNKFITSFMLLFISFCVSAQSAEKYVSDFLAEKSTKPLSPKHKPLPDLKIENSLMLHPKEMVPMENRAKKIHRRYEVDLAGGYVSKQIIDYDTSGQWTKQTLWGNNGKKSITYSNTSTNKALMVSYSPYPVPPVIDTSNIKADDAPAIDMPVSRIVASYTDDAGLVRSRKLYPVEDKPVGEPEWNIKRVYNKDDYIDSEISVRYSEDTAWTTYSYDKAHRLLSARVIHSSMAPELMRETDSYTFKYDKKGNLLSESCAVVAGQFAKHDRIDTIHQTTRAIYMYDDPGRLIRYSYSGFQDQTALPDSSVTSFSYPASDAVVIRVTDNEHTSMTKVYFNQYGDVRRREYYFLLDKLDHISKVDYDYY